MKLKLHNEENFSIIASYHRIQSTSTSNLYLNKLSKREALLFIISCEILNAKSSQCDICITYADGCEVYLPCYRHLLNLI